MLKLPKFLRRIFQRDSSPPPPRPGPTTEAVKQVSVFKEAVRIKDKKMLLALFNASEDCKSRIDDLIEVHEGIQLHIDSAVYTKKGYIDVVLRFSDTNSKSKIRGKWLLMPCPESPTGWKVGNVSQARFTFQMFFKK